ncbi:MAG: ABC transporter permease [Armatimonadota bacterium]
MTIQATALPPIRRFRLGPLAGSRAVGVLVGACIIGLVIVMAIAAPAITRYNPSQIDIGNRLVPPVWTEGGSTEHLLGTDQLGRDLLSRLAYGARVSLLVGVTAVAISGVVGVALGLIAGYYRGTVDDVIMRLADFELAFPFILLAIAILAVLGPGFSKVILTLGLTGWAQYCRLMRAQVLGLRETEFVEAARTIGASTTRILMRHILPNSMAPVIVIASFSVAGVIIAEASLSFLGLGIPPAVPSWGGMLSDGRAYIERAWWLVTFPGLALMLTVLSINILGDALRDILDPRLRGTS